MVCKCIIINCLFLLVSLAGLGQSKGPAADRMVGKADSTWLLIKARIDTAHNKVDILPPDSAAARKAMEQTLLSPQSPLGAIMYYTGGLLVDNGWIRILGSGHPRLPRTLPEWNKGKSYSNNQQQPAFVLVADDVLGGFYAIDQGAFSKEPGSIYYLAPDNLEWEKLNLNYLEFLFFCFSANLDQFYEGYRWDGWPKDVAKLPGDKVFAFFPFLWSKDWRDINKVSREFISAEQQFKFNLETRRKLGLETNYHQ